MWNQTDDRRRESAFTLIELLVVISIVALLAAMFLPALNRSKKKALVVACMSNERNLMQAVSMYAMENDSYLPGRGPGGIPLQYPNIVGATFLAQMDDVMPDHSLYYCPDGALRAEAQSTHHALFGGSLEYSYYSGLNVYTGLAPRQPERLDDTDDQFGEMSVVFGDTNRWKPFPSRPIHTTHGTQKRADFVSPAGGFTYYVGYSWGVNVAYIDGHVEWKPTDSWRLNRYYQSAGGDRSYYW